MPQLDVVTYLTQILWVLIMFYFLFFILVQRILPKLQRQVIIRGEEGLSEEQLVFWDSEVWLKRVRGLDDIIFIKKC